MLLTPSTACGVFLQESGAEIIRTWMNVNKGAVRAEDSIGMEEKRELVCPAAMVASI
jgi:hypothetical protein